MFLKGPPVFVTKIDMMQYDQPGKIFNLEFIVYTKSQIKSYDINSANNDIPASMLMTSINKTMNFHGTLIYVEAIKVVLSFKTATVSNCHNYTVTLGNGYGNNSFVVELKSVQEGKFIFYIYISKYIQSKWRIKEEGHLGIVNAK